MPVDKEMIVSYYCCMKIPFATTGVRGRGRPREFDMDAALDGALLVFRERGYHAASIAELGASMQLTAGSLYKAFSDKRAIFLAAFDRYIRLRSEGLQRELDAVASGRDKLRAMLIFYAESAYGVEGRRGCLVAGSASELATFDAGMAARVEAALLRIEAVVRELIELGRRDGSLPAGTDAGVSARAVLCLLQGMRVVGKTGPGREEMLAIVENGLRLVA
ncbi:TetR/AcrR family transcriptional regulator [Paludibacterium yongneupense]|uniref:TetR/AcrR family transcriptional regulator n=1 Tax=Paludibacterium yongneupense TaxID=400061 RepID=UPI000410D53A|nr:TetR/AcrR family transcriptional regulator [Paludibacterium yongneupense]